MVRMWMLVKTMWRTLARLLRHFGWGALLPLVAAMGMALLGVQPWTVALVVLALIVAAWWPAIAADLVPATMLVAGIWALMVTAVAGAQVNWLVTGRSFTFRGPPHILVEAPGAPKSWHRPAPPPTSLPGPRVVISGPGGKGHAFVPYTLKGVPYPVKGVPYTVKGNVAATARGAQLLPWRPGGPSSWLAQAGPPPRPFPGGPPQAVVHSGGLLPTGLLVPLALLLLALGLWLTPRAMARLRDRMPWLVPYLRRWALEHRWGVLLVPVAVFGLVVFGVHPWTVAAVLVAVIAAVRWPKVAADL